MKSMSFFWIAEVLSFSGDYSMSGRSLLSKVTQLQQSQEPVGHTGWRGHVPIQPTFLLEFGCPHYVVLLKYDAAFMKCAVPMCGFGIFL